MEHKQFDVKVEENKLQFGLDFNKDGQKVLIGKLGLGEAIQEAVARQEPVEGVKLVDFRFELTKLYLKIDSDRDGEEVFELSIDLAEALDEAGLIKQA